MKEPGYLRQRERGRPDRAMVVIDGRRVHLGEYGSDASRAEYHRVLLEWKASGRRPPGAAGDLGMEELLAAYLDHAEGYYTQDGGNTSELGVVRQAMKPLRTFYGDTLAADFGAKGLKAVRERLIESGFCRSTVNAYINRIRRMYRWAVGEELIPPEVLVALRAIPALRRNRSAAVEPEPVAPVPEAHVDQIRPHVARQVWALVQLQRLTAARPGELLLIRRSDLDTSGRIWTYNPAQHKTAYRGSKRTIYFGPRGQEVLRAFLEGKGPADYLFSPKEAEAERRARQHAERMTPLSCGNRPGTNRRGNPEWQPGEHYTIRTYERAIERGCKAAGVPRWCPNRLRHNAATFLRKEFGLDAARTILGHSSPVVTEIYAELDEEKAVQIMEQVG